MAIIPRKRKSENGTQVMEIFGFWVSSKFGLWRLLALGRSLSGDLLWIQPFTID